MSVNDSATLVIGSGNYLTAPTGTALPANILNPPSPWTNVGHTSLEDIFSITSEGGEATTIGTLQNKSLRTKYSARTETMTFVLQQFDKPALKLYFGQNAPELPDGTIGVPAEPEPTECAFLAVFVDGDNHFAFYSPKSEIYRSDDMSMSDTESLAGLPLGVKPLAYNGAAWTYAVTPLGVAATGATAGEPGYFSPVSASLPANLAAMTGITATPNSAWAEGEHVVLGDGSMAHWSGTLWAAGLPA
ncbi:hypothetical protein [Actinocorallia libanotica]|uniref:Major tail protein n=1 Tax=Actinocorallia libanotica TaxID=46162 RepID=A0ABP4CH42_9ACTN